MLGWKYFCHFYLLLLYQIRFILAEVNTLDECSNTNIEDSSCSDTTNDTDIHCLSKGFIYRVNTSGECVSKINSSVHVFDADKKEVDLTVTGKIKDADVENYSMYACSASGCTRTTGYIKINKLTIENLAFVSENDEEFVSGNNEEYILTDPSSDSVFSVINGEEKYDGIILKRTPNVIYHDNSPNETTIIIDTDTKKEAGPLNVSELSPTSDLDKYYVYKCKNGCCKIIIGHNIINISTMKIIDVTD
ncbi:hypothetical protein U3516DRAFT_473388, partial [Neocallimastix sp. 'constans']